MKLPKYINKVPILIAFALLSCENGIDPVTLIAGKNDPEDEMQKAYGLIYSYNHIIFQTVMDYPLKLIENEPGEELKSIQSPDNIELIRKYAKGTDNSVIPLSLLVSDYATNSVAYLKYRWK